MEPHKTRWSDQASKATGIDGRSRIIRLLFTGLVFYPSLYSTRHPLSSDDQTYHDMWQMKLFLLDYIYLHKSVPARRLQRLQPLVK